MPFRFASAPTAWLLALSLGCGPQTGTPTLPAGLLPAELPAPPSTAQPSDELPALKVRFYAGAAYRARVLDWDTELDLVVASASALLADVAGFRLVRADTVGWKQAGGDMARSLQNLQSLDPGLESDLVVALIDAAQGHEQAFDKLVGYELFGRHLVVRSYNQLADSQSLPDDSELSEAARDTILDMRRRHKQAVLLAHGVAAVLGAPLGDTGSINGPTYSKELVGFDKRVRPIVARAFEVYRMGPEPTSELAQSFRELAKSLVELGAGEELIAAATARADAIEAPKAKTDLSALRPKDQTSLEEARKLLAGGKAESAWVILEKLLELYPEEAAIANEACVAAHRRGGGDVVARCQKALELDANGSDTRVALARALTKSDPIEAAKLLRAAEELMARPGASFDRAAYNQLAFAYQDLAMPRAVLRTARDHDKLEAWAKEMQSRYGTSVGLSPEQEGLYLQALQGALKLIYANQIAKAETAAEELAAQFPSSIGKSLLLCERDARRRRIKTAVGFCQEVVAKHPQNSWAHYLLGSLAHRQKQSEEAGAHWRQAIEFDPRLKAAYQALGKLYAKSKDGRLDALKAAFKERFGSEL